MLPNPPNSDALDGVLWWRFSDQTKIGHAMVVLGGVTIWIGMYLLWLEGMLGGLHLLATEGMAEVVDRQEAVTMATMACYVWFSFAFMLGKGGPFLNLCVYPIVPVVIGPWGTSLAITGELPGQISTGSSFASLTLIADVIRMVFPGVLVGSFLVVGFLVTIFYITGTGAEWEAKHMPQAWHEHKQQMDDRDGD